MKSKIERITKSWKKLEKQIASLREKHKGSKYRVELPSLTVEQNVAPLGNKFAPIKGKNSLHKDANIYPVGHNHKQGLEMLTPDIIKNHLSFMSGKKT
jgi:hypothetical protein